MDRGALDAALTAGAPCGGWCPAGRRAEDGPIPLRYPLREAPSPGYAARTRLNVRDSDGTLVLCRGAMEGGTALTAEHARRLGRPLLVLDPDAAGAVAEAAAWLRAHRLGTLNVAGPRASEWPCAYAAARCFVAALIDAVSPGRGG